MQWYYNDGQSKIGPLKEEDIERLVKEGKITSDTMVWNELSARWQPYGALRGSPAEKPYAWNPAGSDSYAETASTPFGFSGAESRSRSNCSVCGRFIPDADLINSGDSKVCAACKSAFFQKSKEGVAMPVEMNYAGFWIRFVAKFIDGIILWIIGLSISFAFGLGFSGGAQGRYLSSSQIAAILMVNILQLAAYVTYTTFFIGRFGATIGKMACGIKIVTPDGNRVSYMRAFGRYFAEILSGMILLIGYIMAAFDYEKRALHDRICSTRVIKN
jgi:uncharacterized RDD family membrane protein YckC